METPKSAEALLKKGFSELGLECCTGSTDAFMTFLSELKRWNRAYNLTGLKKDEDIVIKHFLDSLLYLRAMPEDELKVADVGSGAGLPGIPLKILRPEIEMYLIEPTKKKAAFLRHIVRQLSLNKIEVIEKRIEEVKEGSELPSRVDIAITRALFDIREFIKKASHILKPGGRLVLSKGPKVKEELITVKDARCEMLDVILPLSEITRHIVVVTPGAPD